MDYAVVFTSKAAEEFAVFSLDLSRVIDAHFDKLASDPASYGKKPYFPFRPGGLMSEFKHSFHDRTCYVRIFFHFGAGEDRIVITGFSVQSVDN
jgi:hypothetical protein